MKRKIINRVVASLTMILALAAVTGCSLINVHKSEVSEPSPVVPIPEPTSEVAIPEEPAPAVDRYENNPILSFSTVDINGNSVSLSDFSDAKLIMLNFWEPWCGPCVGEMPDLEELYEKYKGSGFVIIGAYSTSGMDDEVRDVMDQCKTTYPIVQSSSEMYEYMTEYVPTTIFMDGHGHVITSEPYIGSNSYSGWDDIINTYLN